MSATTAGKLRRSNVPDVCFPNRSTNNLPLATRSDASCSSQPAAAFQTYFEFGPQPNMAHPRTVRSATFSRGNAGRSFDEDYSGGGDASRGEPRFMGYGHDTGVRVGSAAGLPQAWASWSQTGSQEAEGKDDDGEVVVRPRGAAVALLGGHDFSVEGSPSSSRGSGVAALASRGRDTDEAGVGAAPSSRQTGGLGTRAGRRPAASARLPTSHMRLRQQLDAVRPPTRQKVPAAACRSERDILRDMRASSAAVARPAHAGGAAAGRSTAALHSVAVAAAAAASGAAAADGLDDGLGLGVGMQFNLDGFERLRLAGGSVEEGEEEEDEEEDEASGNAPGVESAGHRLDAAGEGIAGSEGKAASRSPQRPTGRAAATLPSAAGTDFDSLAESKADGDGDADRREDEAEGQGGPSRDGDRVDSLMAQLASDPGAARRAAYFARELQQTRLRSARMHGSGSVQVLGPATAALSPRLSAAAAVLSARHAHRGARPAAGFSAPRQTAGTTDSRSTVADQYFKADPHAGRGTAGSFQPEGQLGLRGFTAGSDGAFSQADADAEAEVYADTNDDTGDGDDDELDAEGSADHHDDGSAALAQQRLYANAEAAAAAGFRTASPILVGRGAAHAQRFAGHHDDGAAVAGAVPVSAGDDTGHGHLSHDLDDDGGEDDGFAGIPVSVDVPIVVSGLAPLDSRGGSSGLGSPFVPSASAAGGGAGAGGMLGTSPAASPNSHPSADHSPLSASQDGAPVGRPVTASGRPGEQQLHSGRARMQVGFAAAAGSAAEVATGASRSSTRVGSHRALQRPETAPLSSTPSTRGAPLSRFGSEVGVEQPIGRHHHHGDSFGSEYGHSSGAGMPLDLASWPRTIVGVYGVSSLRPEAGNIGGSDGHAYSNAHQTSAGAAVRPATAAADFSFGSRAGARRPQGAQSARPQRLGAAVPGPLPIDGATVPQAGPLPIDGVSPAAPPDPGPGAALGFHSHAAASLLPFPLPMALPLDPAAFVAAGAGLSLPVPLPAEMAAQAPLVSPLSPLSPRAAPPSASGAYPLFHGAAMGHGLSAGTHTASMASPVTESWQFAPAAQAAPTGKHATPAAAAASAKGASGRSAPRLRAALAAGAAAANSGASGLSASAVRKKSGGPTRLGGGFVRAGAAGSSGSAAASGIRGTRVLFEDASGFSGRGTAGFPAGVGAIPAWQQGQHDLLLQMQQQQLALSALASQSGMSLLPLTSNATDSSLSPSERMQDGHRFALQGVGGLETGYDGLAHDANDSDGHGHEHHSDRDDADLHSSGGGSSVQELSPGSAAAAAVSAASPEQAAAAAARLDMIRGLLESHLQPQQQLGQSAASALSGWGMGMGMSVRRDLSSSGLSPESSVGPGSSNAHAASVGGILFHEVRPIMMQQPAPLSAVAGGYQVAAHYVFRGGSGGGGGLEGVPGEESEGKATDRQDHHHHDDGKAAYAGEGKLGEDFDFEAALCRHHDEEEDHGGDEPEPEGAAGAAWSRHHDGPGDHDDDAASIGHHDHRDHRDDGYADNDADGDDGDDDTAPAEAAADADVYAEVGAGEDEGEDYGAPAASPGPDGSPAAGASVAELDSHGEQAGHDNEGSGESLEETALDEDFLRLFANGTRLLQGTR